MKVIVVGAGGHARVVLALLGQTPGIEICGIADQDETCLGERIGSSQIITSWKHLPDWRDQDVTAVALAIGENRLRKQMFHSVKEMGFQVVSARHPSAWIDPGAALGEAHVLCAGAILCAEVRIGSNVLINTGAIVDHECSIGDHAHIGPGVNLAGRIRVGEGTFIGVGSSVRDKIQIGEFVTVGAGSVVVSDLPSGVVAYGVPARIVKRPDARELVPADSAVARVSSWRE